MLETLLRPARGITLDPELASALANAAQNFVRLDQALASHPLRSAFLHRVRLESVRRQSAVDGRAIDPWHLAAILEGLRLRMDGALRIIDRGAILDAARHALALHQWLVAPDFDQEGEVREAAADLAANDAGTPLLAAALWLHRWLSGGGRRAPARAALVRFWSGHRLLGVRVPLTGAALRADASCEPEAWVPLFLRAFGAEAMDAPQLLLDLERAWLTARRAVAGRRRHSRAAAAVDILAAAPVVSATSLAAGLGMAVKNASLLLEEFRGAGIAIEVTGRAKQRLFGLPGLAPLRDVVRPPYRPEPGRGRGRPRYDGVLEAPADSPPLPLLPVSPVEDGAHGRHDPPGPPHPRCSEPTRAERRRSLLADNRGRRTGGGSAVMPWARPPRAYFTGRFPKDPSQSDGHDGLSLCGTLAHHVARSRAKYLRLWAAEKAATDHCRSSSGGGSPVTSTAPSA
jgi:hypothetical protein